MPKYKKGSGLIENLPEKKIRKVWKTINENKITVENACIKEGLYLTSFQRTELVTRALKLATIDLEISEINKNILAFAEIRENELNGPGIPLKELYINYEPELKEYIFKSKI